MLLGALSDVFHRQIQPVFYAVDAFMLCAVIHEYALNVLHLSDQRHIQHKDADADHSFNQRHNSMGRNETAEYVRDIDRRHHKDRHGQTDDTATVQPIMILSRLFLLRALFIQLFLGLGLASPSLLLL